MTQIVGMYPSVNGDSPTNGRIGPTAIRDLYDRGCTAILAESNRYWENLAFLQGQQWIYRNRATNTLEELPRTDTRVRLVNNRLASTIRRLVAKSCRRQLVFEVPPTAADDASVEGARIGEAICAGTSRGQNWEGLREELTIAVLTGGTGYLALDWDPSGGTELEKDDPTGRTVGTGEAKFSALSVVEAVTEPGTRDIEYAGWWIKALAMPCKEARETFRLDYDPAADASAALSPIQRKIFSIDRATVPTDLCLVLTYYERPCSDYPDGQVCVVIGDKIVDGPYPWLFPFKDRLNITAARETKVLGRYTGDTILSQAVPVQTAYNMVCSALAEHCKLVGNVRLLWPEFSGDAVDNFSDLPGEVISYMPQQGLPGPNWMQAPALPPDHIQFAQMLEGWIDDILGVHDVSRGEAPRNVQSGSGLAILAEQDDTPVGHVTNEVGRCFARLATLLLETYEDQVEDMRTARVDYPHQVSQTVQWNGKSLEGQTTVVVPLDAIKPVTEAEVWAKAGEMVKMGVFGLPGAFNARTFARYISTSGGEQDFVEATDPDVAKASRENAEMALSEPKLPAQFDKHDVHIEVHNDFRKTQRYERLDPRAKSIVDQHVMAHEVLAAEDVAAAQSRMIQGGADLAMAASGNRGGNPQAPLGLPPGMAPPGMVPPGQPPAGPPSPSGNPGGAPGSAGPMSTVVPGQ